MTPKIACFSLFALLLAAPAFAFNSGSSGADGAFNPTANTELQLPPDGIFNFTDVNVPAGVTVTFKKNAANTPVYILASGNITVAGTISVSAKGQPGGPGGYDGGVAGRMFAAGGPGKGPGGGYSGNYFGGNYCRGGGGGYSTPGGGGWCNTYYTGGGATYGSANLLPLIGGSGGAGSSGTWSSVGTNGAGGGGALLLAANGRINVTGALYADGASSYSIGQFGGSGSGGAIRLIASIIGGDGTIQARGGQSTDYVPTGGYGRIRLEYDILERHGQTDPGFTNSSPREVFAAGLPTLRFVSIAGVAAPVSPTGDADVSLPADVGNPVTVELASSGVPAGSTIKILSAPENGVQATASATITGTESAGTATAQINIADGKSTISATVGFTVTAALGKELAPYANGEMVARVELSAGLQGGGETRLITASGKEYLLPPAAQAVLEQ